MIRITLAALMLAIAFAFAGIGGTTGTAEAKQTRVFDKKKKKWVTKRTVRKKSRVRKSNVRKRKQLRRKANLRKRTKKKRVNYRSRRPNAKFNRRTVFINTKERPGTLIIDTKTKYLYHITSSRSATRYGIGVGREGFGWDGVVKVAAKKKWPSWTPPKEMIAREAARGRKVGFMEGGPKNPLGARALYLHYPRGGDTGYRVHGTNEPWSIGLNMSSGCIRMMNKDVEHLYNRVKTGSKVVVIGPNGANRRKFYSTGFLSALFGG